MFTIGNTLEIRGGKDFWYLFATYDFCESGGVFVYDKNSFTLVVHLMLKYWMANCLLTFWVFSFAISFINCFPVTGAGTWKSS